MFRVGTHLTSAAEVGMMKFFQRQFRCGSGYEV
jgi:hypothetical protein